MTARGPRGGRTRAATPVLLCLRWSGWPLRGRFVEPPQHGPVVHAPVQLVIAVKAALAVGRRPASPALQSKGKACFRYVRSRDENTCDGHGGKPRARSASRPVRFLEPGPCGTSRASHRPGLRAFSPGPEDEQTPACQEGRPSDRVNGQGPAGRCDPCGVPARTGPAPARPVSRRVPARARGVQGARSPLVPPDPGPGAYSSRPGAARWAASRCIRSAYSRWTWAARSWAAVRSARSCSGISSHRNWRCSAAVSSMRFWSWRRW